MNISNQIKYNIVKAEKNKKVISVSGADTTLRNIYFYDTANGRYVKFLKMTKMNPIIICSLWNDGPGYTASPDSYIYDNTNTYVIGFTFTCSISSGTPTIFWIATGIGTIEITV